MLRISNGEHRNLDVLKVIVVLAYRLSELSSKARRRKGLNQVLDIINSRAAKRGSPRGIGSQMPCRVSSGAHEWINEGPAVPARDPVKPTEPVHRPASPRRERRPRGALPQPGVGSRAAIRRVGGRQ